MADALGGQLGLNHMARGVAPASPSLSGTLSPGWPALVYGIRLWVAVCLALYVAFRLELQSAYWAGTTAAIVCQPMVGASLRKGWFRMIGTLVGAALIVLLTALFPQSRLGFMTGLALWGGACAMAASLLRNFASYAAALAGYTAAIIAADTLGAVGGASSEVFSMAITRSTEILVGIVCGTAVLALTDYGGARRRLGRLLAELAAEIGRGLVRSLRPPAMPDAGRAGRRALLPRVSGLGVAMDQAAGEISRLPFRPRVLHGSIEGLFEALSAWQLVATHLERLPELDREAACVTVLGCLPTALADEQAAGSSSGAWQRDPIAMRRLCLTAVRRLFGLRAANASCRLLADGLADGLQGLSRALNGVALLSDRLDVPTRLRVAGTTLPDLLPSLINALRAGMAIGAAELLWVVTAWPSGGIMVLFTAVTVILFSPREDAAAASARSFLLGTMITGLLAAIIGFAVLPLLNGFAQFCLAIGIVLVPAGALSALAWRQSLFVAMATNFIPVLGPANPMSFDPGSLYNTALALVAGVVMAVLAIELVPPLPPSLRARRLLSLTLRDLRRLTCGDRVIPVPAWERRVYGRLAAIPARADLLQQARLVAALSVGTEILRLRRLTRRLGLASQAKPAIDALRRGESAAALAALAQLDAALDTVSDAAPGRRHALRALGSSTAIAEALGVHAVYFDAAT